MAGPLEFTLNAEPIQAGGLSPNTTLLDFLRARGLTGAKEGCAEGDCGACSIVMITDNSSGKPCYRAINSCLVPICTIAGRQILTVEGIARKSGGCHPVQQSMIECHGSQCG